jgi:hypothetical protein
MLKDIPDNISKGYVALDLADDWIKSEQRDLDHYPNTLERLAVMAAEFDIIMVSLEDWMNKYGEELEIFEA